MVDMHGDVTSEESCNKRHYTVNLRCSLLHNPTRKSPLQSLAQHHTVKAQSRENCDQRYYTANPHYSFYHSTTRQRHHRGKTVIKGTTQQIPAAVSITAPHGKGTTEGKL
ncbi:hypothetical protein FF2_031738 [Malus domestica]